ncbi:GFA family protein [Myxococcus stipitatus]|uniref:GFA family protein n=1 Tax=Myxococcus stipitatus TaxID=83455 RepID=UPI0031455527
MNQGGCFCGAIRYEVTAPMTAVTYCHCSKCRKWHGHVGAYSAVDREGFRLTESRGLKWHPVSASAKRGFCVECGSSVLFDDSSDTRKTSICVGTLDAPTGLRGKAHIYVGSKSDYYELTDDLLKYDTFPQR